jgi:hypothetical protein
MHFGHSQVNSDSYYQFGQTLSCALLLTDAEAQALDPRFSDADDDMIADIPSDPKGWVDPAPLVFAYIPVKDPTVYAKAWEGFIQHNDDRKGLTQPCKTIGQSGKLEMRLRSRG